MSNPTAFVVVLRLGGFDNKRYCIKTKNMKPKSPSHVVFCIFFIKANHFFGLISLEYRELVQI